MYSRESRRTFAGIGFAFLFAGSTVDAGLAVTGTFLWGCWGPWSTVTHGEVTAPFTLAILAVGFGLPAFLGLLAELADEFSLSSSATLASFAAFAPRFTAFTTFAGFTTLTAFAGFAGFARFARFTRFTTFTTFATFTALLSSCFPFFPFF